MLISSFYVYIPNSSGYYNLACYRQVLWLHCHQTLVYQNNSFFFYYQYFTFSFYYEATFALQDVAWWNFTNVVIFDSAIFPDSFSTEPLHSLFTICCVKFWLKHWQQEGQVGIVLTLWDQHLLWCIILQLWQPGHVCESKDFFSTLCHLLIYLYSPNCNIHFDTTTVTVWHCVCTIHRLHMTSFPLHQLFVYYIYTRDNHNLKSSKISIPITYKFVEMLLSVIKLLFLETMTKYLS